MRNLFKIYSVIPKNFFMKLGIVLFILGSIKNSFGLISFSLISWILWFVKENIMFDNTPHLNTKYEDIHGKFGILQRRKIDTLILNSNISYYEKGYAQGELMADKMCKFFSKIKVILYFLNCDSYIVPVDFPNDYKDEIHGLVDGYNSWAINNGKEKITFDFVYKYHCLPDGATWLGNNSFLRTVFAVGCSVIIKDNIVGRTLDFCPFGTGGSDTFILKDGNITKLSIPGILGCITGWNNKTFYALNISYSNRKYIQGWPMLFVSKYMLEKGEGEKDINTASSFHITIFDGTTPKRISFAQGNGDLLESNEGITLNFNYGLFESDKETANSLSRKKVIINNFLKGTFHIESLLKHPSINVHDTINSLVYNYKSGEVVLRRNNSFASDEKEFIEFQISDL